MTHNKNLFSAKSILLVFLIYNFSGYGQNNESTKNITNTDINRIVNTVVNSFEDNYVFPEKVKTLKDSILNKLSNGQYSAFTEKEELLYQLSSDFRRILEDKHIRIYHVESSGKDLSHQKNSLLNGEIEKKKSINFNFKKVEWLPGNIGYIRFDIFEDIKYAHETVSSAMKFISNCEAVIIDLRYNPGGKADMGKFLLSYFFSEPTLLSTQHFTRQDSIVQNWSNSHAPTYSLVDKDIYILTSANTASGAEAFTYTLKNYNKAVVVGEKTRGAAHWCEYFYYSSINVEIRMPVAYPINPVTKTNWEKTGIIPDIEVSEYSAFNRAYSEALSQLSLKCDDESKKNEYEWLQKISTEKQKNQTVSLSELNEYVGKYEDIEFIIKDNLLYWLQPDNSEFALLKLSDDHFIFTDSEDYIIKFVRNKKNKVIGYQLLKMGNFDPPVNKKEDR